jgi:hypothetical protein
MELTISPTHKTIKEVELINRMEDNGLEIKDIKIIKMVIILIINNN